MAETVGDADLKAVRSVQVDRQALEGVVDLDVLARWMDGQDLPGGPITGLEALGGGTQNILLRFERGGRSFVFRRGPKHLRPRSNDVIRREMQVLAALAGTDVPHPGFIAGCPDETVMLGAAFYLMEPVDGFNATVGLPELHAGDPAVRRAMGFNLVDGIARLGAVDHVAVGLADMGRAEGFLERQVGRWLAELESHRQHEGYPGPDLPDVDGVAAWLDSRVPSTWTPGVIHGDYHFANVMYRHDGPELAAIVDWEMTTIGDPLLDLGWVLATWPLPEAGGASGVGANILAAGDLPSMPELVEHYAERTVRDMSAVEWYAVLACFKLGIVLEGTNARAYAGKAPRSTGDMLHASAVSLFHRAHRFMDRGIA